MPDVNLSDVLGGGGGAGLSPGSLIDIPAVLESPPAGTIFPSGQILLKSAYPTLAAAWPAFADVPGLSWADIAAPGGAASLMFGVAYGNGVFMAVGLSGELWRSTDDGLSWADIAAPGGAASTMNGVAYGNGVFMAVGNGGELWRSFGFSYNTDTQFFVPAINHPNTGVRYAVIAE